jgi:hypothetical protein
MLRSKVVKLIPYGESFGSSENFQSCAKSNFDPSVVSPRSQVMPTTLSLSY